MKQKVRELHNVTFDSVSLVPPPKCQRCAVTMQPASSTTWKCPSCQVEECTGIYPLRGSNGKYLTNMASEIATRGKP